MIRLLHLNMEALRQRAEDMEISLEENKIDITCFTNQKKKQN